MRALRLPAEWMVLSYELCLYSGIFLLVYALYVWRQAASSGNPQAFAEVPGGVWVALACSVAGPVLLARLQRAGRLEWVRDSGGLLDEARFSFTAMLATLPMPLRGLVYILLTVCPTLLRRDGRRVLGAWLDAYPLGSVELFGLQYGKLELLCLALSVVFLIFLAVDSVFRVIRLQLREKA